jgi:uncharacterized protein YggE
VLNSSNEVLISGFVLASTPAIPPRGVLMRYTIVRSAALAMLLQVPLALSAQMPAPMRGSEITTTGAGEVRVTPDRALLILGVETQATTAEAAAASNARRLRAVLDSLRGAGLTAQQLSTTNYNVNPQFAPNSTTPRIVGYMVTNSVRAEVNSIGLVGKVIDAALAAGANEVSSLSFYSSTEVDAHRRALALAVAQARADAEALATAAGGHLGVLLELSTASAPSPVYAMARMSAGGIAGRVPTPIEAGEQTISANVTARWAYLPDR